MAGTTMNLTVGQLIDDKYEILEELGHGGMGRVYKAVHSQLNRVVAIKVLFSERTAEMDVARSRLEREALALSRLHHPGVVSVYGYGECPAGPYIAMEFVEGRTLSFALIEGPLSVKSTLFLFSQVAAALSYVHEQGIVHRDLKPDNILIIGSDGQQQVKLIDLGLARLMQAETDLQKLTETGFAVGTFAYMSPEECMGAKADPRSDIYSMGVIMYHCLTGRLPFEYSGIMPTMRAHVHEEAQPLCLSLGGDAVPGLQELLNKAMAKNCDERYQTAAEFLEDLRLVESGNGSIVIAGAGTKQAASSKVNKIASRPSVQNFFSVIALSAAVLIVGLVVLFKMGLIGAGQNAASNVSLPTNEKRSSSELYVTALRIWEDCGRHECNQMIAPFELALAKDKIDGQLTPAQRTFLLSKVVIASKDYPKSVGQIRELIEIAERLGVADKTTVVALQSLAWISHNQLAPLLKRSEAIDLHRRVMDLKPDYAKESVDVNKYHLARLYLEAGEFENARVVAQKVFRRHEDDLIRLHMVTVIGAALIQEGSLNQSIDLLKKYGYLAGAIGDFNAQNARLLALALTLNNDSTAAEEQLKSCAKGHQTVVIANLLSAARTRDWVKADKLYQTVESYGRSHPGQYYADFLNIAHSRYADLLDAAGKRELAESVRKADEQCLLAFKKTQ